MSDQRQYSTWGIRRLHTTPFLARTDTNTSRTATAMANQGPAADAIVIDMGDLSENKQDKKHDTLFGPNIGIVTGGPNWAVSDDEKKATKDELTPEVVKSWVAKSKQAIQPTTTLQALVNLKRPTLKLSPLEMHPSDDPAHHESQHHHALEFEYDCDAPKCGVYVDVILTPEQCRSGNFGTKTSHITVYESVFEGGFGKLLTLEDGAMLELGRFENNPHSTPSSPRDPAYSSPIPDKLPTHSELPELHANSSDNSGTATPEHQPQERERRRRFTALHFRRRTQNRSVSGPALVVVDAEPVEGEKSPEKSEQPEEGVRVLIRIVALGEDGRGLAAANEQKTYLHVVRFGPVAAEGEDDTRPWVVKVVKREATIGVHTFHLHEIYGLSSASSSHPAPQNVPSPTSTQSHTYPPVAAPPPVDDEPSSECLLCLSSPREVVLLPCRHLVACKECAVNMIEFGAGGTITHSEPDPPPVAEAAPPAPQPVPEDAPPAAEGAATESESAAATDSPAPEGEATPPQPAPVAPITPIAPVPPHPRRKRRPKGWFCPVCRQPYTSLLRITTSPPTDEDKLGKRTSTSTYHENDVEPDLSLAPVTSAPSLPLPVDPIRGDRPSFIRGLALSSAV
ncbi:hypothetical protein EVG20_g9039 [Dentipellis fragilis]|uniref:RING-type domain-containing protein n=1 Tax=Dentipellis fragilis TaxID=205917 RepID=A0A4Y9Y1E4_9AGAM|nr:hypothetical protein EVG20_g9039 [Dentipellis fragilis]